MGATRPATILGGLPVMVTVEWGKDADTPNGPGEYWVEVQEICWLKKDGTAGKPLPQHIIDRAERADPYFCAIIEQVNDQLAYEAWEKRRESEPEPDFSSFRSLI